MMHTRHKLQTTRYMILYLIVSLLFAVSVKLHIHTGDAAEYATHGSTVAVSTPDHLVSAHHQLLGEIEVSLDKFPKKITKSVAASIMVVASPVVFPVYRYCVAVFSDTDAISTSLPFAGTPPLRAPPR